MPLIYKLYNYETAANSQNLQKIQQYKQVCLRSLHRTYYGFQRWWHIQEKLGLYVYPIAIAGGFILVGVEGSGKSVEAFLYNPKILIFLGVTLLLLVPACYYGARWMYNYAYGKHLKNLKLSIDELSENE